MFSPRNPESLSWNAGTVSLEADITALDEAVIVEQASVMEMKVDRRVFHVGTLENDDELLATDAVQAVRHADTQVDDIRDAFQYAVAGGVAVGVVDLLEMIDIEQHDACRRSRPSRSRPTARKS